MFEYTFAMELVVPIALSVLLLRPSRVEQQDCLI
jgi:hypothetical protein